MKTRHYDIWRLLFVARQGDERRGNRDGITAPRQRSVKRGLAIE